jgi:predicted ATPase
MLTKITVRNFKRFSDVDVELAGNTVFIGPNDSGKTTALQALAVWELGLRRWLEKHGDKEAPEQRPGATLNRRDLISIPVPSAKLLWKDLHTQTTIKTEDGQRPRKVRIEIVVSGVTQSRQWECGLEFDYANPESLYCRPLRLGEGIKPDRMPVPDEASDVRVAFLPPMSGLAATEPKWEPGRIDVLLGEGQTAQVLRNHLYTEYPSRWHAMIDHMDRVFGVALLPPDHIVERGEITMSYETPTGIELDLSSAGRGCQQTLLVLAHLYANPGTVLLVDEPDAHLEILRQRQIYQLITEVAREHGSQFIAASHSEVLLNEAADRDTVVAFVGEPHRIDDRGSQAVKALKSIGFDQYYQAQEMGWVLYLEGSTDLAMLRNLATKLDHTAAKHLERPFVHYAGNQPGRAADHFFGLAESKPDLLGIGFFDRDVSQERLAIHDHRLNLAGWGQQEIENYICTEEVLMRYARGEDPSNLFDAADTAEREASMRATIDRLSEAYETRGDPSPWSADVHASAFLERIFELYFEALNLPVLMRKTDYHQLVEFVEPDEIDKEVVEKLDSIVDTAEQAQGVGLPDGA